jgi:hypothetical protein
LVVPLCELGPSSSTVTPASGLPRRSVVLIAAVPEVVLNAPGAGVSNVDSLIGWLVAAGEVTVLLTFRYSAWAVSSVQLSSIVLSRIQVVSESTWYCTPVTSTCRV